MNKERLSNDSFCIDEKFNILNTLFTDNKNPDMYAKINHRKMKSGELKKDKIKSHQIFTLKNLEALYID